MYLHVNKPVKARYTFAVAGSSIDRTYTKEYYDTLIGSGRSKVASHDELRPLFRDGKLSITCSVEFDLSLSLVCLKPSVFQSCDHLDTDVTLIMGSDSVQVHKSFLTLISPVFHAMFAHDTKETRSGKVNITDFDYDTVKAAIDFCYGRQLKFLSMETVVGVLRFADKYTIKSVTAQLEKLPFSNLLPNTFSTIVHYAYDCSQNDLLGECCKYFKRYQTVIKNEKQFAKLPPSLVVDVIKSTFGLEANFDVLRHAHKNGILFILDYLEQPLLTAMTLNDFCAAADYAWKCSREDLKKVCAAFWYNDKDNTTCLPEFHDLPPATISGLVKLGFEINKADVSTE